MKTRYVFIQPAWLFTLMLCPCVHAQTLYMQQGFEGTDEERLPVAARPEAYGSGALPTWNAVERIRGIDSAAEGNRFWAARDVDNATSGSPTAELQFAAGDICNLTSARFVFAYQVIGYDGGDDFGYELLLDGFPAEREVLVDGRNGGGVSTAGWVYDTVSVPGTVQTAELRLFFDQNGDDVAAVDHVQLLATGDDGSCRSICGIRLGEPRTACLSFTADPDALSVTVPYSGAEVGARVFASAGSVAGDDPALTPDGNIVLTGLLEGERELLSVVGGDCDLHLPIEPPVDYCAPSSVVINEVLAAPAHDVNGDGSVDPGDEFVELYNTGSDYIDLSNCRLHDGSASGARYTFPDGSGLAPGESFVVFARQGPTTAECASGEASGFLGLNDDTPESVILRDAEGKVIAQARFDDAPEGESLVLVPDGNLAGGYHPHGTVDGRPASLCAVASVNLPVLLYDLRATSLHDAVRLDWRTEREDANAGFVVDRGKDATRFDSIGWVAAAGPAYHFVDDRPLPGQNLYRLRQVDLDGAQTIYGPVSVRLDSGAVRPYPNPAAAYFRLSGGVAPAPVLRIFRSDGRFVRELTGPRYRVADLPAGLYYLRLPREEGGRSFRLIKE